jgi:hypothetical protein
MKSFQLKQSGKQKPPDDPGNPTVDFRGEKRSNETHQSKTDPESELARRGDLASPRGWRSPGTR